MLDGRPSDGGGGVGAKQLAYDLSSFKNLTDRSVTSSGEEHQQQQHQHSSDSKTTENNFPRREGRVEDIRGSLHLPNGGGGGGDDDYDQNEESSQQQLPPPSLLSPAFTPPSTPGTATPSITSEPSSNSTLGSPAVPVPILRKAPKSTPVDTSKLVQAGPKLLETLPSVNCIVRARIPTTLEASGHEMYLHLYQNDNDNKEHLAIVFGNAIRSKSLFAVRPGETEEDRMTRGAYDGRLYPGRTSSKVASSSSKLSSSTTTTTNIANDNAENSDSLTLPTTLSPEKNPTPPLVRIHSECYTGETVWSARCDCGEQLDEAARLMALPSVGSHSSSSLSYPPSFPGGVIIYLRQEGRGIGLGEKLKAYNLQDLGSDTVEANLRLRHPADARSYGLATAMLLDLGLGGDRGIRLLTNNPDKVRAVEGPNREIRVRERVEMVPISWRTGGSKGIQGQEIGAYMRTKIEKMGHMLQMNQ